MERSAEPNSQTMQLLVADPDFRTWVKALRKSFSIPARGFKAKSPEVNKWLSSLDEKKWEHALGTIFDMYTKINEASLPHIAGYIKFGVLPNEPLAAYKVYYSQRGSAKHNKVTVEIYSPLAKKDWDAIKLAVDRHFRILETPQAKPINLEHKALSLRPKQKIETPLYTAEYGQNLKETDFDVLSDVYPDASLQELEAMARTLPKERERMKELLKQRLGKV